MTAYICVLRRSPGPWEAVEVMQGRRRPQRSYLPPLKRDKGHRREPDRWLASLSPQTELILFGDQFLLSSKLRNTGKTCTSGEVKAD